MSAQPLLQSLHRGLTLRHDLTQPLLQSLCCCLALSHDLTMPLLQRLHGGACPGPFAEQLQLVMQGLHPRLMLGQLLPQEQHGVIDIMDTQGLGELPC